MTWGIGYELTPFSFFFGAKKDLCWNEVLSRQMLAALGMLSQQVEYYHFCLWGVLTWSWPSLVVAPPVWW
jgi:hypothetical protein